MNLEHYKKILNFVHEADNSGLMLEALDLTEFSGEKVIGVLQRLAKFQITSGAGSYLEIGVFQGLTLISVANVLKESIVYGVDNFAFFDPKGINKKIVEKRVIANDLNNVCVINSDYEDALENLEKHIGDPKIGAYFVDGPHDYRSQLICLNLAKPYLSDCSIIVVDDCNYRHVRLANRDFLLANPDYKLLFEAYTDCHPGNMDKDAEQEARKGWWNGVNIIVHDPNNILNVMLPETHRDRQLYENEHIVHSAKYGELAPEAVSFLQSVLSLRLISAMKQVAKIFPKLLNNSAKYRDRYLSMNTYSEQLSKRNCNKALE